MGINVLVAHGGGPTAVINSSLQGVLEAARADARVDRIYGARFGAQGILSGELVELTGLPESEIKKLAHTPASALGSCRRKLTAADYPIIINTLRKYNIGCFLYNGGNDSMDTCNKISSLAKSEGLDVRVIGIPKTMDNDLECTDHCPGFGSAAWYAAQASCELALDACALPIHVVVLELMGRNAGWVTAASALADRLTRCEVLTYLPERKIDIDAMLADIDGAWRKGRGLLVTVSEGLCGTDGTPLASTGIVDGFGHVVPGGTAQYVADNIIQKLGIKARAEKPGLLGRASIPYASEVDRKEAYAVGRYALEAALAGKTDSMVAIDAHREEKYSFDLFLAPLSAVANAEKKFPLEWITGTNKISDEFFEYAMPLMTDRLPEYAII